ncbi:WAT1-related protein At4g01440-like [Papaver somniferum]|uniref:WAT1-related protein At4g01440-like n=1 Tax=Papaver somniferum TaxID=3469 RepID=UPI000E6FED34|nr:WAT1-related protein At4g01440-like [Papaver somniferum]
MDMVPALLMIFLQFVSAGNNVFNKLALDSGMNPQILVAYRQILATCFLAPAAVYFERGVMHQCLYFTGLKHTTPTIACALLNTAPAITFILAILFRMETIGIHRLSGQAKVIGTIVCVGGAAMMSFYTGSIINIGRSTLHWRYAEKLISQNTSASSSTITGPTAFASALAFVVTAWCISKRGPLYVSMFSPIALVIVAVLDWALMDGEIYVGSVVGSVSIAIGLYAVLWGKGQEAKESFNAQKISAAHHKSSDFQEQV